MKKGMKRIVLLLVFSLSLSYLFSQTNNDSVKVIIIGFESNKTYQFFINQHIYEFKTGRYDEFGCFIARFPQKFFNSEEYYFLVRCKNKVSLHWEDCEVAVIYDSTKKYFLLYRDYRNKSACFQAIFSNEIYSKGYDRLYEEGSEKKYGPNRVYK